MKVKHVFTTLGLALVMGMGVAAGASLGLKSSRAKAVDTKAFYLVSNWDWGVPMIHYWGGSSSTTWGSNPSLTKVADSYTVDGQTGAVYSYDVPVDTTGIIIRNQQGNQQTANYEFTSWGDVTTNGAYFAYTNNSNQLVPCTYVETPPAPVSVYKASINGGTGVELVKNGTTTEYMFATDVLFTAGDVLTFTIDDEEQVPAVKADGGLYSNNVSLENGDLVVTHSATSNLYWDVNDNTLWVGGFGDAVDGSVYLVGSFNDWGGIKTVATTEDDTNYTFSNLALAANSQIKAFQFDASGADDDAKRDWVQPTAATSTFPVEFPVSFTENGNVTISNANTYNITVNVSTGAYTIEPTTGLPTYTVTCDGYQEQTFVLDEDGKPEGVYHQYSATILYAVRAKLLKFYINDVEITDHIGVDWDAENNAPVACNNIVGDATNGFKVYYGMRNMKVYFKTYQDGGMSLWGNGYNENTFYVSGNNYNLDIDHDFEPYGDYIKQFKTSSAVTMNMKSAQQEKYSIYDEAGYVQSISFDTEGDNNAYQSTSPAGTFNVHNSCKEVIYIKMKADLSLVLYIGGRTHDRTITIDGTAHLMEAYQPEGEPLQYRLTGVDLTAGTTLTYKYDGVEQTVTAKAIGNNNLTSDLKVLADAEDADIYLDPVNMTLWVSGLGLEGATGFHLLISNSDSHTTEFLKMTQNPANENEYFSSAHAFKCNDVIKIVDCSHSDALPYVFDPKGGLNDYSNDAFILNAFDEVYCQEDVTVSAYIQLASNNDKLYFGSVPAAVQEAIRFTTDFASHMHNSCSTENGKQAAVEAAWAQAAGEYALLSAEAKAELAKGSLENCEYDEIADFYERYISIKTQHSDWNLENFMNWTIPSSSNYVFNGLTKNNNALIIVLVAATIAISSIGLFFIIRRKKYSK